MNLLILNFNSVLSRLPRWSVKWGRACHVSIRSATCVCVLPNQIPTILPVGQTGWRLKKSSLAIMAVSLRVLSVSTFYSKPFGELAHALHSSLQLVAGQFGFCHRFILPLSRFLVCIVGRTRNLVMRHKRGFVPC